MSVRPAIIPCLRYEDAPAAIDFLCDAFGFERHAVFADADDPRIIHHAQLVRDGQLIMLSSAQESEFSCAAPMVSVKQAGANTQSAYVVVDDVDAHAAQARAAGASIYMEPRDHDYGGRGYGALDLESNAWSFGTRSRRLVRLKSRRSRRLRHSPIREHEMRRSPYSSREMA